MLTAQENCKQIMNFIILHVVFFEKTCGREVRGLFLLHLDNRILIH